MTEVDKVRFDFTAWLLKQKSGSADFTGFFQYGGGSFDGQLSGSLSLLAGAVKVSADQGAVDLHFGSGAPWHIYLGQRDGPNHIECGKQLMDSPDGEEDVCGEAHEQQIPPRVGSRHAARDGCFVDRNRSRMVRVRRRE